MKLGKLLGLFSVAFVLAGCVSLSTPTNPDITFHKIPLKERQAKLQKLRRFTADGAFSIVESGKKPVLANYQWKQSSPNRYRIRVYSPLDIFNVIILGRSHSVTLWKNAKKQVTASTPEQLIRREMGWRLPIRDLYYWIRGVVAPGLSKVTADQFGHVSRLKQGGWTIRFDQYTEVGGYDVPQRLILKRPKLRVTLVVKHWKFKQ